MSRNITFLRIVLIACLKLAFSFTQVSNNILIKPTTLSDQPLRIGHGFDIHRLVEDRELIIAGVKVPSKVGAEAHSDGDAVYHSIVDSILGALCLPDIGQLFPDNDPNWKNADSSIFMEEAYKRMNERGYKIGNLDVTLILQAPKVKDLKPAMKQNIVRLLRTSDGKVNIKARTHEKVDSIGESRSYACHVVVLLEKDLPPAIASAESVAKPLE